MSQQQSTPPPPAAQRPTFINLPPPVPDTPEAPGTPTSTTTSLSALSTTAIKDGHRGHLYGNPLSRIHGHNSSTASVEAERADRISRLTGLDRLAAVRASPSALRPQLNQSPSTTATSSSFSAQANPSANTGLAAQSQFPQMYPSNQELTAAYLNAHGHPLAGAKPSTVGTASATTASRRSGRSFDDDRDDDSRTNTEMTDGDGDVMSITDTTSLAAMAPEGVTDEEMVERSIPGVEDRLSDDGSASLVAFGEGAGSTVSGPTYQRRPIPAAVGSPGSTIPTSTWPTLERSASGFGDVLPGLIRRDMEGGSGGGGGGGGSSSSGFDTPISAAALQERREARFVDGVAADSAGVPPEEMFVDTTTRSPVPTGQIQTQPHLSQQQHLDSHNQGHDHQSPEQQRLRQQGQQQQARSARVGSPPLASREVVEGLLHSLDGDGGLESPVLSRPDKDSVERLDEF